MRSYPRWMHHPSKDSVMVSSAEEEKHLGPGWVDSLMSIGINRYPNPNEPVCVPVKCASALEDKAKALEAEIEAIQAQIDDEEDSQVQAPKRRGRKPKVRDEHNSI